MLSLPPSPPALVELHDQRLTFAEIDELAFTRAGDTGYVRDLRMRIDESALVRFLGEILAGGPVGRLAATPVGPHLLQLRAEAFGLPLTAELYLGARHGRALISFESASAGWLPISGRFLRDEILASSQAAVVTSGMVRPAGADGLSFEPDYLFGHMVAGFPGELARHGLPLHLRVYLRQVALTQRSVLVEGGD